MNSRSCQQQEPAEATAAWLDTALERRRNPRPFRSLSGERQREVGEDVKLEAAIYTVFGERAASYIEFAQPGRRSCIELRARL